MTADRRALAARALIAKALSEEIAAEIAATRRALNAELLPGEPVRAVLPDGRIVGSVQFAKPSVSVRVVDPDALMEYVKRVRPDEVVVREEIRGSYMAWLLDEAKKQLTAKGADGLVVDPEGEVIPGLELFEATPSYRQTFDDREAVDEVVEQLFRSDAMRALLPGGER